MTFNISGITAQADGRLSVVVDFTDKLGRVHRQTALLPKGTDVSVWSEGKIPNIEQGLIEREKAEKLQEFLDSGDWQSITFDFATKKQVALHIIKWAMRQENPNEVLKITPLMDWLKANYAVEQIANYLGISEVQVARVNSRFNALAGIKVALDADKTMIEDIE